MPGVRRGAHPPTTSPARRYSTARHEHRARRSRRHLRARRRRALRRPAGRGGRRRHARRPPRRACRAIVVDYEVLPAVFDPEAAARARRAAACTATRAADARIADAAPQRRRRAARRGRRRRRPGFAAADVVVERRPGTPQRVAARAPGDPRRRSAGSTTTAGSSCAPARQVPFLIRDELCRLFDLPRERVRVFTARVGGGFGGKQEMLTEDLVALAVLRTGRPVQLRVHAATERVRRARRAGTRCACRVARRRAPRRHADRAGGATCSPTPARTATTRPA